MTNQPNNEVRLIAWHELDRMVPYTRQHILRLEKRGRFPSRVRVGEGRVAWVYSEVVAWIEARKSERFEPAAITGTESPGNVIRLPVRANVTNRQLNQNGAHGGPVNREGR